MKKGNISDRGVQSISKKLEGRKVAVAVCGGIGSVEVVKIIRELRRHGAEITAFLTPSVSRFITELSIEWAAGRPVVTDTTAQVDYLEPFDLVVVSPATLNTINKAALGISDNVVTLLIAGQIGRKGPVLWVPTMNLQLQSHPLYAENVARLKKWRGTFLEVVEEDRLKMPAPEKLAAEAIALLGKQ